MKKYLSMLALAATVVPCIASADSYTPATYLEGRNVYVRLIKQDAGWRFSDRLSLAPSASDERGIDVLLNDLTPSIARSDDNKVQIQCLGIAHCTANGSNYKDRNDAISAMVAPWTGPFYRNDVNVGTTLFSNTVGLVLTLGVTAGASDSEYSFDHAAFAKAVKEAMAADGMTDARRKFLLDGVALAYNQMPRTTLANGEKPAKKVFSMLALEASHNTAKVAQAASPFTASTVSYAPAMARQAWGNRNDL